MASSANITVSARFPWWNRLFFRLVVIPLVKLHTVTPSAAHRWVMRHYYYRVANGRWFPLEARHRCGGQTYGDAKYCVRCGGET